MLATVMTHAYLKSHSIIAIAGKNPAMAISDNDNVGKNDARYKNTIESAQITAHTVSFFVLFISTYRKGSPHT
jgi:hypothetical protein